jgi:hypothetical protein
MDDQRKEKSQNRGTGTDAPAIQALNFTRNRLSRRALLAAAAMPWGCSGQTGRPGQPLPGLELVDERGEHRNARDLEFPCVLVLFHPFCPACSRTLVTLTRLQESAGPLRLHLLVELGRRPLMQLLPRPVFPVWYAKEKLLERALGRLPRPVLYFVDAGGMITSRQIGSRSDAVQREAILSHLR